MKENGKKFISTMLGDDFLQDLVKFEVINAQTDTAISHDELADALKVVPRTLMSWLISNLTPMQHKEVKVFDLPFGKAEGAKMNTTKVSNDVYHAEIYRNGKVINKTSYRSIPGLGLVLLSTFELYDIDDLISSGHSNDSKESAKINFAGTSPDIAKMIDERLALRDMISSIVDGKLSQRDAIEKLVLAKIGQTLDKKDSQDSKKDKEQKAEKQDSDKTKKGSLKKFLDSRKKKGKKTFNIELKKHDIVSCPDCGCDIFTKGNITGCMCFGENRNSKVYLAKTDSGFKVSFSKDWDQENIEMLLSVLRKNWENDDESSR